MTNRKPMRDRLGALGWRRGSYYRGSRVTPVEGRDLSSRQTQYVVKDLEIGKPINSENCSEAADGVARESVKSCPRAGCGRSACPIKVIGVSAQPRLLMAPAFLVEFGLEAFRHPRRGILIARVASRAGSPNAAAGAGALTFPWTVRV